MLRWKMFMIILAAAALGAGTGWAFFHSVLPGKTWATVIASTEAPPPATPAPAAKAVPSESAQYVIRIDGKQSELRLGGKDTGLYADKDGVSLRTLFGKFELRW
jgi:hypothetical protein